MRSIRRRFEELKRKNVDAGDYLNLVRAVKSQNFSKDMISRWFNKLIGKDEYVSKDKRRLIEHLVKLSGRSEDNDS